MGRQVGTALLSYEAGTSAALKHPLFDHTVVKRVFFGRYARVVW
nr:nitronate monooxygenase [Mycobacterium lepromatosis]